MELSEILSGWFCEMLNLVSEILTGGLSWVLSGQLSVGLSAGLSGELSGGWV